MEPAVVRSDCMEQDRHALRIRMSRRQLRRVRHPRGFSRHGKNAMRKLIPIIVALLLLAGISLAQQAQQLEVLQLRPNFYMIVGAGGNIGVQVGNDGVVVVDSGSSSRGEAVLAAIKKITTQPIRYVINTSADADHVGGNEALAK